MQNDPNTVPPVVPVVGQPNQAPAEPPAPAPEPAPQGLPQGVPPVGAPPRMPPSATPPEPAPAPVDTPKEGEFQDFRTGNSGIDAAIDTFIEVTGAKAADLDRATRHAVEYSNPALIDEAFLREKFGKYGDRAITLAKEAISYSINNAQAAHNADVAKIYSLANGEANWKTAVSVFNSTAPQHLKDAVAYMLDNDNVENGAQLLLQTVNSSGLLPQSNGLLNNGAAANTSSGALSAEQFKTEYNELRKAAGNRSLESGPFAQQYQDLVARRTAGKQLGR